MPSILSNSITDDICYKARAAKYFASQCDEVTSNRKVYILLYISNFKINERCKLAQAYIKFEWKIFADVILGVLDDRKLPLKAWLVKVLMEPSTHPAKMTRYRNIICSRCQFFGLFLLLCAPIKSRSRAQ